MEKKTFYITTPIYYPSDKLHIGHSYCTVATDAIARYKRLQGYDVMFLTGTDEHGQKIETKAEEAGMTPQAFVDKIVNGEKGVRDLWKLMNISNDRFIRTTDDYHCRAVQRIFKKMYEKGDIYKGAYKGKYCTPCESFWTESQLVDGKCPDCGREVVDAEEEAKKLGDEYVSVEHLFLAMMRNANSHVKDIFRDYGVSREAFLQALQSVRGNQKVTSDNPEDTYDTLEKYGEELVSKAKDQKMDPVIGRDDEIRNVIRILSRKTKSNPVIIGEPGVGKTAIAEGLAQRIVNGDVPSNLASKSIYLSLIHI